MAARKFRVSTAMERKREGRRIVVVTAHDAMSASVAEEAGADVVLVGDSLGNTCLGLDSTIPVTLDMMIHHAAAVARAARSPLLVGDMPFMTYKVSPEQALANCARMIQEGGMEAVKIEGGAEMAPVVARLVQAGIPVMAHAGLLPQSVHAQGGFRVQGRTEEAAERLLADARALEDAGAFALVLECMPADVAGRITREIAIPTIGIGAGGRCDGQVLVYADLLGMTASRPARFVRRYADLRAAALEGVSRYAEEVRSGAFPGPEHEYES